MTNHANPEILEINRFELMYVLCKLVFLLRSARNQANHVACTSQIQLSRLDTGTLLDASVVQQP